MCSSDLDGNLELEEDNIGLHARATITDPEVINKKAFGGIFPIGGESTLTGSHKGYGLGIIAEIFTGILSGGDTSPHVKNGGMGDTSFGFFALDYGLFGDKKTIRARVSTLLQELRDSAKADGHNRIYTHGEIETESMREKMKNGIPASEKTIEELIDRKSVV